MPDILPAGERGREGDLRCDFRSTSQRSFDGSKVRGFLGRIDRRRRSIPYPQFAFRRQDFFGHYSDEVAASTRLLPLLIVLLNQKLGSRPTYVTQWNNPTRLVRRSWK